MEYSIRIAPSAHKDIDNIAKYIQKDRPSAAVKMIKKIYDSFEVLQKSPFIGAELSKKFKDIVTDFRFFIVAPHIVFYKVDGKFVDIYRVLDGRRDYLATLGFNK